MIRLLFVVLTSLLVGCTIALWTPERDFETIVGFYVNKERHELLVATQREGYLFTIESGLGESLLLSRRIKFRPEFKDFAVDRENRINGTFTLIANKRDLGDEDIALLESVGFKRTDQFIWSLTRHLQGRRYEIQGDLPMEKLAKGITVGIKKPSSYTRTAGQIIATPAALTIDAVVTVPAAFVVVAIMAAGSP